MWRSDSKGRDSESSEIPPDEVSFDLGTARLSRQKERLQMVSDTIRARGVEDARVLGALANVPRHAFVP